MRKLSYEEIKEIRKDTGTFNSSERHPVCIMLHNVRSLYNVGSIFRTADSAGIAQIVLCGFTPHPPRKEIEKTALGAVDTIPWRYFKNSIEAVETLRNEGWTIAALEITNKKRNYYDIAKNDFPLCLVAGNELTGIDNEILEQCDLALEIPMYGTKHSLNVSVAVGIAVFEAVRIFNS